MPDDRVELSVEVKVEDANIRVDGLLNRLAKLGEVVPPNSRSSQAIEQMTEEAKKLQSALSTISSESHLKGDFGPDPAAVDRVTQQVDALGGRVAEASKNLKGMRVASDEATAGHARHSSAVQFMGVSLERVVGRLILMRIALQAVREAMQDAASGFLESDKALNLSNASYDRLKTVLDDLNQGKWWSFIKDGIAGLTAFAQGLRQSHDGVTDLERSTIAMDRATVQLAADVENHERAVQKQIEIERDHVRILEEMKLLTPEVAQAERERLATIEKSIPKETELHDVVEDAVRALRSAREVEADWAKQLGIETPRAIRLSIENLNAYIDAVRSGGSVTQNEADHISKSFDKIKDSILSLPTGQRKALADMLQSHLAFIAQMEAQSTKSEKAWEREATAAEKAAEREAKAEEEAAKRLAEAEARKRAELEKTIAEREKTIAELEGKPSLEPSEVNKLAELRRQRESDQPFPFSPSSLLTQKGGDLLSPQPAGTTYTPGSQRPIPVVPVTPGGQPVLFGPTQQPGQPSTADANVLTAQLAAQRQISGGQVGPPPALSLGTGQQGPPTSQDAETLARNEAALKNLATASVGAATTFDLLTGSQKDTTQASSDLTTANTKQQETDIALAAVISGQIDAYSKLHGALAQAGVDQNSIIADQQAQEQAVADLAVAMTTNAGAQAEMTRAASANAVEVSRVAGELDITNNNLSENSVRIETAAGGYQTLTNAVVESSKAAAASDGAVKGLGAGMEKVSEATRVATDHLHAHAEEVQKILDMYEKLKTKAGEVATAVEQAFGVFTP